jgi:molybdopterin-containing oxidoreductase family membrane subunit
MFIFAAKGSPSFYIWIGILTIPIISGIIAYAQQFNYGLVVTHLSDQVSWGAYIANFTYLVGVSDA